MRSTRAGEAGQGEKLTFSSTISQEEGGREGEKIAQLQRREGGRGGGELLDIKKKLHARLASSRIFFSLAFILYLHFTLF